MGLDYFKAYHRYLKAMSNLTDSECGRLFRALLEHSAGDTPINLKGRESVAFDFIASEIDAEAEKAKERSEINKANVTKRYEELRTPTKSTNAFEEKKKEKNQKKEEKNIPPYSPPKGDGEFASFWDAYPRKTAKQAAEKAFAKVNVPLDVLLKAIERQKRTEQWQDVKYIPHPSTWLNQGRWEDEVSVLPKAEAEAPMPKPRRFILDENGIPQLVEE